MTPQLAHMRFFLHNDIPYCIDATKEDGGATLGRFFFAQDARVTSRWKKE